MCHLGDCLPRGSSAQAALPPQAEVTAASGHGEAIPMGAFSGSLSIHRMGCLFPCPPLARHRFNLKNPSSLGA